MAKILIVRDKVEKERLLQTALHSAGLDLSSCLIAESESDLRDKLKAKPSVIVPLGAAATRWVLGKTPETNKKGEGFIHEWRGSLLPTQWFKQRAAERGEDYLWRQQFEYGGPPTVVVPTLSPGLVSLSFDLHPFFLLDLQKASKVARSGMPKLPLRKWFVDQPQELERLLAEQDLLAVDTEFEPKLICFVSESEVHLVDWDMLPSKHRATVKAILTSPRILKVAHNWSHDAAWLRVECRIDLERPYFDTYGGCSILNSGLPKDLSPSFATRFTNWPYHKWLVNHDAYNYCGMDTIVTYDGYWPQVEQMAKRDLLKVAEHDHKLFTPLIEMQAFGFKIDETARAGVESELLDVVDKDRQELQKIVEPIISAKIGKFQKPHLFRVMKRCDCCGGGSKSRLHCPTCSGWGREKTTKPHAIDAGFKTIKLFKESWISCLTCSGAGKVEHSLPFNANSSDQVADVIYRGLGIKPRRFEGVETTRAALLDPIKDKHPLIAAVIEASKHQADLDTTLRLKGGFDGRSHCVFDPWGTGSGRVGGKEGLVETGTNPMNIPKPARRFVVPDDGHILLYPDMNAIEARAVAVISGDKKLMEAFTQPINWPGNPKHGKIDSHTRVMQLMLEEAGLEIDRDGTKRLTYASMYGGAPPQIAKEINAEMFRKGVPKQYTEQEVERMQVAFFKIFSGLRRYQYGILDEVFSTKRLRCPLTGRERTWNERVGDRKTKKISNQIAKQVWSYLPQNMAAWVLAKGLIDLRYKSDVYGTLLRPLIHVHDALLMQAPLDQKELAISTAQGYLTRTEWGMFFPSEMKTGANWFEAS